MKNPWMSAWLSAANKAAGPARGAWAAEAKRQQNAFMKALTGGVTGTGTAKKSRAPAKKKR